MNPVSLLAFNSFPSKLDACMKIPMTFFRFYSVKTVLLIIFFIPVSLCAQDYTESQLIARLKPGGDIAEDLLSKRSIVLYSYLLTEAEIISVHENLAKTGIDAVAYFETDRVLGGYDITKAYTAYFARREIANLVIVQKSSEGYALYVTAFNSKSDLVNIDQSAWSARATSLSEALGTLFRSALSTHKPKNFLINEIPEKNLDLTLLNGIRYELFAYDLKVDKLAVPKFGSEAEDRELEEQMKNYPFKYQLVDNTLSDSDLRKQGFIYVLRFVHTRAGVAKGLLGYTVSPSESAFVSVTFSAGQVQLKNIPGNTSVFKFYPKQIESGNYFLGTKWDADVTWQLALKNFIDGFKAELKIN